MGNCVQLLIALSFLASFGNSIVIKEMIAAIQHEAAATQTPPEVWLKNLNDNLTSLPATWTTVLDAQKQL
jgi:hypothetical protein